MNSAYALTCRTHLPCTSDGGVNAYHSIDLTKSNCTTVPTYDYSPIRSRWSLTRLRRGRKSRVKKIGAMTHEYGQTGTIFLSLLFCRIVSFRRAIARVLWTTKIDRLLTLFESFMGAVWKRTSDDVNFSRPSLATNIARRDLTQQSSGAGELYERTSDSIRE